MSLIQDATTYDDVQSYCSADLRDACVSAPSYLLRRCFRKPNMAQRIRIQYASHLMLPFHKEPIQEILKPVAPILALCGNIGHSTCPRTREFLEHCDRNQKTVFWIPGALEQSSPEKPFPWFEHGWGIRQALRDWNLQNIIFSQKLSQIHPTIPVRFVATPLWLGMNPSIPVLTWNAADFIGPMPRIYKESLHQEEKEWIEKENRRTDFPIIALTSQFEVLGGDNLIAHIHGADIHHHIVRSYSGGKPWTGMNMQGHSGFLKDVFVELELEQGKKPIKEAELR